VFSLNNADPKVWIESFTKEYWKEVQLVSVGTVNKAFQKRSVAQKQIAGSKVEGIAEGS